MRLSIEPYFFIKMPGKLNNRSKSSHKAASNNQGKFRNLFGFLEVGLGESQQGWTGQKATETTLHGFIR